MLCEYRGETEINLTWGDFPELHHSHRKNGEDGRLTNNIRNIRNTVMKS